jgi:hypothetical protein
MDAQQFFQRAHRRHVETPHWICLFPKCVHLRPFPSAKSNTNTPAPIMTIVLLAFSQAVGFWLKDTGGPAT